MPQIINYVGELIRISPKDSKKLLATTEGGLYYSTQTKDFLGMSASATKMKNRLVLKPTDDFISEISKDFRFQ